MQTMDSVPLQKLESLTHLGLENLGNVYWDLPAPALYEEAIRRHEGIAQSSRAARRAHRAIHGPFAEG